MKNKNFSGGLFAHKPTPLTIKETPLSAQIKDYLDNRSVWNERLQCGKIQTMSGSWIHLCEKGTPDRIAIVRGHAIFIEVKMRGEKPTGEQLAKHSEIEKSGAIVLVADSFEQFKVRFNAVRVLIETRKREVNFYD